MKQKKGKRVNKLKKHKRAKEKTKNALHEQLKEQEKLEAVQVQEQDTARKLISEASVKLTNALQGSGKNLQAAKVAQVMLTTGYNKLILE